MSRVQLPFSRDPLFIVFAACMFAWQLLCAKNVKMFQNNHAHDGFQRTEVLTTKEIKFDDFPRQSETQPCVNQNGLFYFLFDHLVTVLKYILS